MNQIEQIVEEAWLLQPSQIKSELIWLCQQVAKINPSNVLEIGTKHGGTFRCWCSLSSPDGLKISVDLPAGEFGGLNMQEYQKASSRIEQWSGRRIVGDSHEDKTIEAVSNLLVQQKLDFLFIDGDHSYQGVRADYLNYSRFVRPGGLIAFHDIVDSEHHRKLGCHVAKFWAELDGIKSECVHSTTWGGIGILMMPIRIY